MSGLRRAADDAAAKLRHAMEGLPGCYQRNVEKTLHNTWSLGYLKGQVEAAAEANFKLQRRDHLSNEMTRLSSEIAELDRVRIALEDLTGLCTEPKLEKPDGSAFHKLLQAMQESSILYPLIDNPAEDGDLRKDAPGVFIVEHNWASAFTGAQDFRGGDFRLPYDPTCFEFRISGHRLCALFQQSEKGVVFVTYALTRAGWAMIAPCLFEGGQWIAPLPNSESMHSALLRLIGEQVRAVSIALDAEVAVSDTVRAPHKLNAAREKRGALPLRDYHVISLARRSRAAPLASGAGSEGTRKRLHFRRGHWRHYEDHKTWIRWTLVGDPDLGFIDKHYRL